MKQACAFCGRPTIRARSIDDIQILRVDEASVSDGELALIGDLDDEPTAIWNFEPADMDFWELKEAPSKHRPHRCARTL
jgi:hypothetical protein